MFDVLYIWLNLKEISNVAQEVIILGIIPMYYVKHSFGSCLIQKKM